MADYRVPWSFLLATSLFRTILRVDQRDWTGDSLQPGGGALPVSCRQDASPSRRTDEEDTTSTDGRRPPATWFPGAPAQCLNEAPVKSSTAYTPAMTGASGEDVPGPGAPCFVEESTVRQGSATNREQ